MKIKWLVIISIVCGGLIYISLMLNKQNTETKLEPQPETIALKPEVNYPQPLPEATLNLVTKSPPALSAVTLISKPAQEPQKQVTLPNATSYESSSSNSDNKNNVEPGITKTGKQPTRKESQEMQSKGIVLY